MPVELVPFFGDSASHWKHGNKNVENNNNIKIQMKALERSGDAIVKRGPPVMLSKGD